ncbi:MAG TPA: NADH-ubiquinone oxidoreductase-F iron-sulfur binding region domain-containing protein [Candidatus Hydrogenedentes bacterium]|nr:NADH-ubiquinone oxidoreductase-F iron-sulfur binding region domain-containing protein [Candidatus Hydrogenedentota bacterium]
MKTVHSHVLVCAGAGCVASGAHAVIAALEESLRKHNLNKEVELVSTGCLGPCAIGPVAVVYPDGVFYQGLKPEDAEEIVSEHLLKGRPVSRLNFKVTATAQIIPALQEINFFQQQQKIVLRNCGVIDPTNIEEYIARDGYQALARVLTEMTPEEVTDTVKKSGLRGRGGAGFLTGLKWEFTRKAPGDKKYVLCNADEGDPGAFMDRSVLEGDPHSVIEAMIIAGYGIGSDQGYVYVRAEYPLAVDRLQNALNQAREMGLLGNNIMGTKFNFDLEIRMGSGAFVCGEETALMRSIEGKRGEPRPRPPFPAIQGLWEKPSLLNNVETYANIPVIFNKGAEWYASIGTEKSKGTKVFALAGAVNNTGLVEVPVGTPLGEIIYDIGGGIPNNKKFKAAQIGGPSGGCIPREHLNVPVDYETLTELGAIMGSGGLIVMDEDTCMVDMARFFLDFVQDESCGKCVPCRVGTKRMLEIVSRICEGKGEEGDVEKLIALGQQIKDTALCGLGQTAPNPVLSTIRHFREEYDIHIREKRCPAGVCPALVRAPCMSACPANVYIPGFVSLVSEKRYAEALRVHRDSNPFASVCARVCFHTCEDKCRRSNLDDAVAIRGIKRFMVEQEVTIQLPEMRENEANAKRKVAIIGGGPAGLTCAYFLARLGYQPKVFESAPRPGGMLVQCIPAYRMPREELAREIRMIERMGVEIETNKSLGKDFTLQQLRDEGYEAVFLAVGAPAGAKLRIANEDAQGVYDSIEFLREYNLRGSAAIGKKVVVIGGGNAAVDAARTAVRLGAESVTILYRRTRDEMPAYKEEIEEAENEGVIIKTLVAPQEIVSKSGKVAGVRCNHMWLGDFDSSGRRRPQVREDGDSFVEPADQVIAAVGQSLDTKSVLGDLPVKTKLNGFVASDALYGRTSLDWLFAGGDTADGPSSVAEAIGAGERAAVGIDLYLTGEEHAFWRETFDVDTEFDPDADPSDTPRAEMKLLPEERRVHNFNEVEMAYTESVAVREARRCLRCDFRSCGTEKSASH